MSITCSNKRRYENLGETNNRDTVQVKILVPWHDIISERISALKKQQAKIEDKMDRILAASKSEQSIQTVHATSASSTGDDRG